MQATPSFRQLQEELQGGNSGRHEGGLAALPSRITNTQFNNGDSQVWMTGCTRVCTVRCWMREISFGDGILKQWILSRHSRERLFNTGLAQHLFASKSQPVGSLSGWVTWYINCDAVAALHSSVHLVKFAELLYRRFTTDPSLSPKRSLSRFLVFSFFLGLITPIFSRGT